jgi:hypothetical protein
MPEGGGVTEDELNKKRLDVSIQTRNLEIDLFWKRSLFFWGFISAAFVGYAALRQSDLRIVLACFGLVCSCAWTLVNRGSKYWQENWETKVERFELPVTGVLFGKEETPQSYKGWWLRGRQYSVSKLAIALSDYVFLLWLAVVIGEAVRRYAPSNVRPWLKEAGTVFFVVFSALYVVLMLVYGRKTPRPVSKSS